MDADTERRLSALEKQLRELRTLPVRSIDLLLYAPMIDQFWGDTLDARWNTAATGSATVPTLQSTSPSRLLWTTGTTINSVSTLNEAAVYKWSAADAFTIIVRAKISSVASIAAATLRVAVTGNDKVVLGFDSSVNATFFYLQSSNGGTSTTTATDVTGDTGWHIFSVSVKSTYVRGRIDGGTITEITTNIPTIDMGISLSLQNRVAADKQMEVDYVIMIPGYNLF